MLFRSDPVATYAGSAPGNQAIVDLETGRRWNYAELHAAVDRLAAWLVAEFGPASGVRVATLAKNCAEILILQTLNARELGTALPGIIADHSINVVRMTTVDESLQALFNSLMKIHRGEQ